MDGMSYQVLLVEDRIADAELIQEALRQSAVSCSVTHVRRLADALERTLHTRFDAVLLNLALSDSRGLDTYVAMRSHASALPLILITNADSHTVTLEAMKKGAEDYLRIEEISPSMLGKALLYAIERKRHEHDLRTQKEFYENLLREANVWVEALDRQGNVILWNKGAEKISGYASETMLSGGSRWELLYPDENRRREMVEKYAALLENERGVRDVESEIRTASGETRLISWNSNIIRGNASEVMGCMLVGSDITDQRSASEGILRSEQRFRVLSELTSDYVYSATIDENGGYVTQWVEGAFERITGVHPDEILGRANAWFEYIHPGDLPSDAEFAAALQRTPAVFEYRVRRRDGSYCWLRDSIHPTFDGESGGLVGILGAVTDISEEKQARESERLAKRTLDALINSSQDYAFLLSSDGTLLSVGSAIAEFFGMRSEEMTGKKLFDFIPDDYPEERRHRLHQLCQAREVYEYTTTFRDHYIRVRGTPVFDEHGGLLMVIVFSRDVTDEVRAQETLRREEEKLRGIIENSTDGILLMDAAGSIIEWNPSMERITGIPKAEALRLARWEVDSRLLSSDEAGYAALVARMKEETLAYLASGNTDWLDKIVHRWIQRPDAERRFIEMVSFPVRSSFGMLTGSIMRDITEIKIAEQDVEEQNRRLHALIHAIPDMVYFKDLELRNILANQAYADFAGRSIDELAGLTEEEYLPPDLARQSSESDREVVTRGVTLRREELISDPDSAGGRWYETVKTPLLGAEGKIIGLIGVSRDITERKTAELKLSAQNAELRERNEELDTFTHSVAHDLKNPLSLILGYADMVQFERGAFTAKELHDYMGSILFNGRKMIAIINSLLLLASVREEEVVFEPIEMRQIVGDALRRLQKQITDNDVAITLPNRWFAALGYAPWIEEVWVNYIGNAIKHGGKGRKIAIGAERIPGGLLRYSVTDDGPGIPANRMDELFLPFTRLAQAKIEGHGLGLSIVKRIIEKTGGEVDVISEEGRGSTFRFTIPEASAGR